MGSNRILYGVSGLLCCCLGVWACWIGVNINHRPWIELALLVHLGFQAIAFILGLISRKTILGKAVCILSIILALLPILGTAMGAY
jgi:hypothetical protein